jgi:hypothetical protein
MRWSIRWHLHPRRTPTTPKRRQATASATPFFFLFADRGRAAESRTPPAGQGPSLFHKGADGLERSGRRPGPCAGALGRRALDHSDNPRARQDGAPPPSCRRSSVMLPCSRPAETAPVVCPSYPTPVLSTRFTDDDRTVQRPRGGGPRERVRVAKPRRTPSRPSGCICCHRLFADSRGAKAGGGRDAPFVLLARQK